jgi:dinuclear metal center YbgI/SA1388 family protein
MKAKELINALELYAPLGYQEEYDNSGLNVGNPEQEITGVLCTIDITLQVLEEALAKNANMIVSHHPLIFRGIKSLTGKNFIDEIIIKAIKNDLVLYAVHTNIDNVFNGVNSKICQKLELNNCSVLAPLSDKLLKLVTYVPVSHANKVREAIFSAGAGFIGNYDCCSFNSEGTGTFRANEQARPFVGKTGELHQENETRIETVLPSSIVKMVIDAMLLAHPYEEVAYDLYPLKNKFSSAGAGMIGDLIEPIKLAELLHQLKNKFNAKGIKFCGDEDKPIKRIAVCGGSGSFLIRDAKQRNADAFITGDIKYHEFFESDNSLSIIDIGHFESEQFTKEIFYEVLIKNFPKFAVHLSETNSNPIKYYS